MSDNRHPHWRVSVETSGEQIVAIEPEMLAGREISEADEDAIRTAAHHLLAFIGDAPPQTKTVVTDAMVSAARAAFAKATGVDADHQFTLDGWIEDALRSAIEAALAMEVK